MSAALSHYHEDVGRPHDSRRRRIPHDRESNRLVFTWGWDGDADKTSLITLTFRDAGGKTEFTLRQEGLGTVENRKLVTKRAGTALDKLQKYLAKEHA